MRTPARIATLALLLGLILALPGSPAATAHDTKEGRV